MAITQYTNAQVIQLAEITQYLSAVDINTQSSLRDGTTDMNYPAFMYLQRRAIEWENSFYPANTDLPAVIAYVYNLIGRYLFQAEQVLGTGTGQIIIPGTGTGGILQAQNIEFIIGQAGSPLNAGDTVLTLTYANIVGGSVNVYLGGALVPVGIYTDRFAYTIVYTDTSATITFNQGVQDTELYNITFLQLIPV